MVKASKTEITIRQANLSEHKEICKIAKESKYTKDFSNMIFSGEDCYKTGRIRIAVQAGKILGFTCFRLRQRKPALVLYFVGVTEAERGKGVGAKLIADLSKQSELPIEFNVMKENRAVKFYEDLKFEIIGEAYEGKAWVMREQK